MKFFLASWSPLEQGGLPLAGQQRRFNTARFCGDRVGFVHAKTMLRLAGSRPETATAVRLCEIPVYRVRRRSGLPRMRENTDGSDDTLSWDRIARRRRRSRVGGLDAPHVAREEHLRYLHGVVKLHCWRVFPVVRTTTTAMPACCGREVAPAAPTHKGEKYPPTREPHRQALSLASTTAWTTRRGA